MSVPSITIDFLEAARTLAARSKKGILCVLLEETAAIDPVTITKESQIDDESLTFSDGNKTILHYAFAGTKPKTVVAIGMDSSPTAAEITAALDKAYFDWVVTTSDTSTVISAVLSYVSTFNASDSHSRKINAAVINQSSVSSPHVVNFAAQDIYLSGSTTKVDQYAYLVRLAAEICACPITESVTYKALSDVAKIGTPGSTGTGYTYLVQDDDLIRISTGVMSDGTKIALQQAKDMICEDITLIFKNHYLGKVRNSPDNQANFVAAVYGYVNGLASEGIVNPEQEITIQIDADAMRTEWESKGTDTSDMSDAEIRNKIIGSYIYVYGKFTILDTMEDLVFEIELG